MLPPAVMSDQLENWKFRLQAAEAHLKEAKALAAARDGEIARLKTDLLVNLDDGDEMSDDQTLTQAKYSVLRQLQTELHNEKANLAALQAEHSGLRGRTERMLPDQKLTLHTLKKESGSWQSKYNELVSDIDRLQQRLIRIISVQTENQAKLASNNELIAAKNALIAKAQAKADEWRVNTERADKGREDVKSSLNNITEKLVECMQVTQAAEKEQAGSVSSPGTVKYSSREGEFNEAKEILEDTFQQELALSDELDLFKDRLESVRSEFRNYKSKVQSEVDDLKHMLVAAQGELGSLRGNSEQREAMVLLAQAQLAALRPWVGIEIIAGATSKCVVLAVKAGGPADAQGLAKNDIIEQANGEYTSVNEDFRNMIAKVRPGDVISFQVNRRNAMVHLMVSIGSKQMNFKAITQLRRLAGGIVRPGDQEFLHAIDLHSEAPPGTPTQATPRRSPSKKLAPKPRPAWVDKFN